MIKKHQRLINQFNALLDAVVLLLSYLFSSWFWLDIIRHSRKNMAYVSGITSSTLYAALIFAAWTVFLLWLLRVYRTSRTRPTGPQIGRILAGNTVALLMAASALYLFRLQDFSRGVLLVYFIVSNLLLVVKKLVTWKVLRYIRSRGHNLKHMIVVGGGEMAQRYVASVEKRPLLGIQVDECIKPDQEMLEKLENRLHGAGIDEVIMALEPDELGMVMDVIRVCEKCGTKLCVIPFYNDVIPTRPTIDTIGRLKLIQLRTTPMDEPINAFVKRGFDFVASLLLLILLSPLFLILAIAIKLSSPGPVFFRQERIGLNKKPFIMYKFRSMKVNDEQDTAWSSQKDDRRTWLGALLRKTSLDELPQLFNTLKGDMSIVGPRPEIPYFVEQFRETVPLYMVKYQVRPGITGWAQVNGYRGDTSIPARVEHDLWYIENWTFWLDIKILLMTVFGGMINNETLQKPAEEQLVSQKTDA
ncbi:MAG: undecaprenyl-phosphate glucose phosphotransferase [Clostridiales bacterium]|nr:undecaprenyl-phosphate glucose phosphotransferase [Clostridiales bacterium]